MTVMEFFGCTFLSFGPPFALFCLTIADDPVKIIILIASAFFWLLALLLSSCLWGLTDLLGGGDILIISVCFSVIFQELLRFVVYLLLRKAEAGLEKVSESGTKLVENKHILAYVSGLGFGIMSGAFALINVLADLVGPGTLGLVEGKGSSFFFVTSSLTTLCFIFLHTAWGVIFFHGMDNKNFLLVGFVVVTHFGASLMTFLNRSSLYFVSIPLNYIILVACLWVAFRVAGGRISKRVFSSNPAVLVVPVPEAE